MKSMVCVLSAVSLTMALAPAKAEQPRESSKEIPLVSVPSEYTPTAGIEMPEPVSLEHVSFELTRSGRPRIEIDYTYPDLPNFGADGGRGPEPSFVRIPGLTYDVAMKALVFHDGEKEIACATEKGRHHRLQPTGKCVVEAKLIQQGEGSPELETYLALK